MNPELEKEFREAVQLANKLIEEKLKEAVQIAEQYGICFKLDLDCFGIRNGDENGIYEIIKSTYVPKTYERYKKKLNWELQELMTGAPNWIEFGWEHSRVC